jgi:glycolate dehydrogenase FAD-binding subunit
MKPKDEAELAEMVAAAKGPLAVQGAATRGLPLAGQVLSSSGLSGIELYEPGALTLVAKAGTPVAEIEAALAEHNQRLAFEPMDFRGLIGSKGSPTIGGVVAGNVSGPRRVMVGAARDFLLGVRFVDGTGTVIRNGGRVMKNVTGYDLVKLMAGSWGTLGILSEVAFKVLPMAETQATLLVRGVDVGAAVHAMSAALGSPFEVSGAAFDPHGQDGPVAMLRLEGFADSVDYRAGRLGDLLGGFGAVERTGTPEQSGDIWKSVRDVAAFHGREGDVWRVSVKPSDAPDLADRLRAEALLFDWGGGLIWALVPEGSDLRARAGRFDGHAMLVRASAATKARLGVFQPQPPALEAISAGLRARFDPRGILNTGLMSPRGGV